MNKIKIFILLFILQASCLVAQDVRLQISTLLNDDLVKLDSLYVENLSQDNVLLFSDLPNKLVYILNLTKGIIEESTNIVDSAITEAYVVTSTEAGRLVINCSEVNHEPVRVTIFDRNGRILYNTVMLLFSGSTNIEVKLPGNEMYLVRFSSRSDSNMYKVLGSSSVDEFSVRSVGDSSIKTKSTTASNLNFRLGDSLQISAFKHRYYAKPQRIKVLASRAIQFMLEDTQTYRIFVRLKEDSSVISAVSTPLRYDKQSALTYGQDDNLSGTVKSVLPLFSGGLPEFDTEESIGRFFTDGFGNLITFKTNSVSFVHSKGLTNVWDWASEGEDSYGTHLMTYNRLDTLIAKGGSLVSHQYWEMDGIADSLAIIAPEEYINWQEDHGNIRPFSYVRGGGQLFSDTLWGKAWFDQGALVGVLGSKNYNSILRIDTVDFSKTKESIYMGRYNIEEHTATMMMDVVDEMMLEPGINWLQMFSHTIKDKEDFLDYWEFKEFSTLLENKYGRFGSDKLWVPSVGELVQYLHTRDKVIYSIEDTDNTLLKEIILDQSDIPEYVKQRGLTFKIKSDTEIDSVMIRGYKANVKRLGLDEYLIDIEL